MGALGKRSLMQYLPILPKQSKYATTRSLVGVHDRNVDDSRVLERRFCCLRTKSNHLGGGTRSPISGNVCRLVT
jgi:hypothetical protein